jgi:radical SAM protein with 4Fe4S-binding SPASM domain
MAQFIAARPALCAGCRIEETCLGGCKAAAQVCGGSLGHPDPFVAAYQSEMRRPV